MWSWSPARILFHLHRSADRRLDSLHDTAVAMRASGAKKEGWKKFLKSVGHEAQ